MIYALYLYPNNYMAKTAKNAENGADPTKHVTETDPNMDMEVPEGPVEPSGSQPSDQMEADGSLKEEKTDGDRYIEGQTNNDGTPVATPENPRSTNEVGRVDEEFAAKHRPRG